MVQHQEQSDTDALLFDAVQKGDGRRAAQALADGADPNRRGPGDMTPLIMAAHRGHAAVMTALINAGADVNARDAQGETALSAVMSRTRGLRTGRFNIGILDVVWKRRVRPKDDGTDDLIRLLVEAGAKP